MERGDSLIYKSGSFGVYTYATVSQQKAVAAVSRGSNKIMYDTRGCAATRLTPRYVLSPRLHGALEFRSPSVRCIAPQIDVCWVASVASLAQSPGEGRYMVARGEAP